MPASQNSGPPEASGCMVSNCDLHEDREHKKPLNTIRNYAHTSAARFDFYCFPFSISLIDENGMIDMMFKHHVDISKLIPVICNL